MAAKRNGLGKGLDSLIPNKTAGKSEKHQRSLPMILRKKTRPVK